MFEGDFGIDHIKSKEIEDIQYLVFVAETGEDPKGMLEVKHFYKRAYRLRYLDWEGSEDFGPMFVGARPRMGGRKWNELNTAEFLPPEVVSFSMAKRSLGCARYTVAGFKTVEEFIKSIKDQYQTVKGCEIEHVFKFPRSKELIIRETKNAARILLGLK